MLIENGHMIKSKMLEVKELRAENEDLSVEISKLKVDHENEMHEMKQRLEQLKLKAEQEVKKQMSE